MAFYGESPSCKAMIERKGVPGPADLAMICDEAHVVAEPLRLRDCGASEVAIVPFGSPEEIERTIATLGQLSTNTWNLRHDLLCHPRATCDR